MEVTHIYQIREFQRDRYLSKLIHDSDGARVALFCLESGQEIPTHTTPSEVVFYVVEGKGKVIIGDEETYAQAGTMVFCPPEVSHGLAAGERFVVLAVIAPRP